MNTFTIILYSILFIMDFYVSTFIPIKNHKDAITIMIGFIKISLIWSLLVVFTVEYFNYRKQVEEKCPQYEVINEQLYKLKE